MDDPANAPFMESIGRGECPRELEPATRDVPVTVNLVRSHAPYAPPARPAYTAFQGTGRTLAGTLPAVPFCC
jgi:UBX domain-containing protein 1